MVPIRLPASELGGPRMKSKPVVHESPATYRTPHCPRCDTILEAHINQGQLIGWDCLACGKAIKIERAVKGRE